MSTETNHVIYENFILQNKLDSLLTTKIDLNQYITLDRSLTANAGMKVIVNRYTATGDVEDLAMGEGNTDAIIVSATPVEYTVGTTQGRFIYYDEQAMTDPTAIDKGLITISEKMTNDLTAKAIAEWNSASTYVYTMSATPTFDDVVDAVALMNREEENNLFMFINPAMSAKFKKSLGVELKYVESFVRTGYIGTINNIPVVVSKAVPDNTAFIAMKDAVTCYVKKDTEVEQERVANTRQNTIYGRKVMLVALTDETKVVKMVTE